MQAVVLAAGKGTRLQPLTDDKPKGMVEVDGQPLVAHVFDRLVDLDADELIVVVGHMKEQIIEHFGDEYRNVPITYAHQREQAGLAHALLTVEEHVDDDFMPMLRTTTSRPTPRTWSIASGRIAPTRPSSSRRCPTMKPPATVSVIPTSTARSSTLSRNPTTRRATSR